MSLKLLIEESETKKEEVEEKARSIWAAILFDTWVSYAFWGLVITSLTMLCKPILYWSAMTESVWVEILLKSIVAVIAIFNIAVIYTWIKGSEFYRRFKCWVKKD